MESSRTFYCASKFPQILATIIASITLFCMGSGITWTSPALPDIKDKQVFGNLSDQEESWIASLVPVGALFCGPLSAYTVDKIGRRMSLLLFTVPMTIGWTCITFSANVGLISMYMGRFLTGLAIGGNSHVVVVYVSEIAQQEIRGALMSILTVSMSIGILFSYILGTFLSWFVLSLLNIFFPICIFVGMYFMPETPLHLLNKGKKREAGQALLWLRGATSYLQIQDELNQKFEEMEESKEDNAGLLKSILSRSSLKSLAITLGLMTCQQLSGINAVLFFALSIFKAAGTTIDPNLCSIIIGLVILCSVFVNSVLIDRLGRKILMIISEVGMVISLFALGTFFYLKKANEGVTPDGLSFLPLTSLVIYIILYMIGAGPVPWLMMGELLSPQIKGFGCGLATSFNWLLAFIVTKMFLSLNEILEIHGCYFMFGGLCIGAAVFCLLCVPETKNMNLISIQKLYFPNK